MEKRVDTFSQMLKYKIQETRHEMDLKAGNILKLAHKDVVKLRNEVITQFKKNKIIYKKGVKHLTAINDENKNITNHIMQLQTLGIENEFNGRILSIRSKYSKQSDAVNRNIQQTLQHNHVQLLDLKRKVENIDTTRWTQGSYCILANGACPIGFKSINGQMRAISMYSPNATYMKEAIFGGSKISCHGKCGKYGHWIADLFIAACCK